MAYTGLDGLNVTSQLPPGAMLIFNTFCGHLITALSFCAICLAPFSRPNATTTSSTSSASSADIGIKTSTASSAETSGNASASPDSAWQTHCNSGHDGREVNQRKPFSATTPPPPLPHPRTSRRGTPHSRQSPPSAVTASPAYSTYAPVIISDGQLTTALSPTSVTRLTKVYVGLVTIYGIKVCVFLTKYRDYINFIYFNEV